MLLMYVQNSLIHIYDRKDGKGQVVNVSFGGLTQSSTGFGSFAVNPAQVLEQKDKSGATVDGYKAIVLAKPGTEDTRAYDVSYPNGDGTYGVVKMTARQIHAARKAAYKAWKAEQATEVAAE